MSFNVRMDEHIVVYACCSLIKRTELSIHKNLKYLKEASLKRLHSLWLQLYKTLEKVKIEKLKKKISGCQSLGEERSIEWMDSRGLLGSETIPYDTVVVDTRHYVFAKIQRN